MLRIAVLGCGRIGLMHAENTHAHPRAALAGVFDIAAAAAGELAGRLGVRSFATAADIFAAPEVDAVLIATATATHADCIEQAVAAGKPILCEKPIDLSLARVRACARTIAGSRVPIMRGFVRRFDSGHRALRQAVAEGRTESNLRLYGPAFTDQAPPLLNFFIDRYARAFAAEIDAFVDAVETGTPPEVGFADGEQALMLAQAALRSVREGRAVRLQELA